MHTLQFYRHLRETPGEHTYFRSLKEHWNFSGKNCKDSINDPIESNAFNKSNFKSCLN